ncbi:MAG: hypothetical protein U9P44_01835 [archaeon]|nr:hypothetical protein [archaeon]
MIKIHYQDMPESVISTMKRFKLFKILEDYSKHLVEKATDSLEKDVKDAIKEYHIKDSASTWFLNIYIPEETIFDDEDLKKDLADGEEVSYLELFSKEFNKTVHDAFFKDYEELSLSISNGILMTKKGEPYPVSPGAVWGLYARDIDNPARYKHDDGNHEENTTEHIYYLIVEQIIESFEGAKIMVSPVTDRTPDKIFLNLTENDIMKCCETRTLTKYEHDAMALMRKIQIEEIIYKVYAYKAVDATMKRI